MPVLTYPTSDFVPYTKILSSDVNGKFNAIKTLLNTTKLDSTNVQQYGLTRDRIAAGTADHVVINDASGYFSSEAQLSTTRGGLGFSPTLSAGNAGKTVGVNDAGSALELRTPEASVLVANFANNVATLTAGEAISARDAVCLALNEGAYKVFKCDTDDSNRTTNFLGFATAAATVTAQVSTSAITGTWTSGTATITVNGRSYSQAFSSNHNTSVDALCTQIQADADVLSCVATGTTRDLITVTGEGGLTLTLTVTANPTGATFGAFSNTTSPSGDGVRIQFLGALGGFSSLTVGDLYYISSTAGGITNVPSNSSTPLVGQAISSSVLLINPNKFDYIFQQSSIYLKFGGSDNPGSSTSATTTTEHFNLASWSSGTAITAAKRTATYGESGFNGLVHAISGLDSTGAVTTSSYSYNKSSWSSITALTSERMSSASGSMLGKLLIGGGMDNGGTNNDDLFSWNGSSWTNEGNLTSGNKRFHAGFTVSSVYSRVAGWTTGLTNEHDTWNGSSFAAATVLPTTAVTTCGGRSTGSKGIVGGLQSNSTASYEWNGASWSASITMAYDTNDDAGDNRLMGAGTGGYLSNVTVVNGGTNSSSAAIASTQKYNGSAWSSTTASSASRSVAMSGVA